MFSFFYRGIARAIAADLQPLIEDAIAVECRRLDDRVAKRAERAGLTPGAAVVAQTAPYPGQPMGRS